ncbi:MAG: hypothetical protein EZS28_037937, partial [Streblomastix strix]
TPNPLKSIPSSQSGTDQSSNAQSSASESYSSSSSSSLFSLIIEYIIHVFREDGYDYQLPFSFHIQYEPVDSAMIDELEHNDDEEEDEYDSDAELYALDDQSVPDYELGIDFSGFGAVKKFVSEDKSQDGGGNGRKSGGFGGGNGVGYLSESDEEIDDMESLLSNA